MKRPSFTREPLTSLTLLTDALLGGATALLFAYVGDLMRRRHVPNAEGRRAMLRFAVWWYGLAVFTLLGAFRAALAGFGNVDVRTHALLNDLGALPLVALLWGLVSYLAYVYTGRPTALRVVTALHLLILLFYGYVVATLDPVSVRVETWRVPVEYAAEIPGVISGAILVTMLVPALAAAVGYGTLYFRTHDRSARYRIGMTSGAFLLWFGAAGVASLTALGAWAWWPFAARMVGLVATLMILAAYRPPAWVRGRLGIRPLELEPERHGRSPAEAAPPTA